MTLGIDLSNDMVSFSYLSNNNTIKTCYIKETAGYRKSGFFDSNESLCSLLNNVKRIAEIKTRDRVSDAVVAVPGYCGYNQIKNLYNVSNKCGFRVLRVQYSSVLSSLCMADEIHLEEPVDIENCHINVYCSLNPDYIELTVFDDTDGVMEIHGTLTILINETVLDLETIKHQIHSDINQLIKDLMLQTKIDTDRTIIIYSDSGCKTKIKEYTLGLIKSLFGVDPIQDTCRCASKGALLQSLILYGRIRNRLLLTSQNRSINVGLGEQGEYKNIIRYYSTIPHKASEKLFVSSEKMLIVYEGNFLNRKYDTIIGKYRLPDHLEGHLISIEVSVDTNSLLSLSVTDDKNNVVLLRSII